MRQDEELDDQYAAFLAWLNGDAISAQAVCREHGVSLEVPVRNQWQTRADKHHEEVGRLLTKSLTILKDRLKLVAIETAFEMMRERQVQDEDATVKWKDEEGRVRINTKRKRIIGPSERIVSQVIDYVLKEGDAITNDNLSELLQAMVQDTADSGDTPTAEGMA